MLNNTQFTTIDVLEKLYIKMPNKVFVGYFSTDHIHENLPFVVEWNISEIAILVTINLCHLGVT